MTYEYAACFRLLLLCGYTQKLEQHLDAVHSERYFDEPWHTMYYMEALHDEAEMDIYVSKEDFRRKFHALLSDGICPSAYHSLPAKDSVFTGIRKLFRCKRR